MCDTRLPDEHHFARQCTGFGGKNFSDEQDGYREPPWLEASAFQPSPKNPHVSGLWVERVDGAWRDQLDRVRAELKGSGRNIRKTYQLAIVQVEGIKSLGRQHGRELHVLHTPDEEANLPSHSEIRGIAPEDHALQQRIADSAQIEPIVPDEN